MCALSRARSLRVVAYVRTVRTASGATAVQIVHGSRRGSRDIEQSGRRTTSRAGGVEGGGAAAAGRRAGASWTSAWSASVGGRVGAVLADRVLADGHLWDALCRGLRRARVRPRPPAGTRCSGSWCWPGSSSRPASWTRCGCWTRSASTRAVVSDAQAAPAGLRERGVPAASCPRRARRTPRLGPASLVLYDVSHPLLRDRHRRRVPRARVLQGTPPGAADHHRPADRRGRVPADGQAFEGNKAETTTMLPTISAFMAAHQLADVTIVADAGMVSEANKQAIEAAGLSFILGTKIPDIPYVVQQWRREHPDEDIPDGLVLTQPWPAGPTRSAPRPGHLLPVPGRPGPAHPARHRRAGRQGREGRRGEGAGQAQPVHHAWPAPTRRVNRDLEAKARALAGWKGYITNLATCPDGTRSPRSS